MAKKHPNKEIRAALDYAAKQGWRIEEGGSHAWGKIYQKNGFKTPSFRTALW